jgi:hypothetical protein
VVQTVAWIWTCPHLLRSRRSQSRTCLQGLQRVATRTKPHVDDALDASISEIVMREVILTSSPIKS